LQRAKRCTEVVELAEKRIGLELDRGQAEGKLLVRGLNRRHLGSGRDADLIAPATIAELGLTKQQNRCIEVIALADVSH
jgi:hypothetical protein